MSSDDQNGPPAEPPSPRFGYLKRGSGSQKYTQKISYQRRKSSTVSNLRPSTSSVSSGLPSVSTSVDIDTRRPYSVPPLQMSPPVGSVPDSGRGSAAPQEQIYANPSNRSIESGYGGGGGYNRSFIETPDRSSNSDHEGPTLVNEYDDTEVTGPQVRDITTDDDEVFLQNEEVPAISPALSSFVRREHEISKELAQESEMSTPTRELRERIERMAQGFDNRSQTSSVTNHALRFDQSSDEGPLNSTPISFGQERPPDIQLPSESTIRSQESGENRETAILRKGARSRSASSVEKASIEPTYIPETISGSSLGSLNREVEEIRCGNKPLAEAFPAIPTVSSQTPPARPSESTKYGGRPMPQYMEDNLRRMAIKNDTHRRRELATPVTTSSDEFQPTPLRKVFPRAADPIALDIRRQLRDGVSHMDLGQHNLRAGLEQVKRMKKQLEEREKECEKREARIEQKQQELELESQRRTENFRRDRLALEKREKDFNKLQSEKDKENRELTVTNKSNIAGYRVQMNKKDQELQKLKEEKTAVEESRARLERVMEQQQLNSRREIKKLNDIISERDKRIALLETEVTKRRAGLQPRPQTRNSPLSTIQPAYQIETVENNRHPSYNPNNYEVILNPYSPSNYETDFNSYNIPEENRTRKQVQFNLGRNTVHNDSYIPDFATQYHEFVEEGNSTLPMGVCRHYINKDNGERTYFYKLRHNDGKDCMAKLFKYQTNDAKFIYGPIEAYLFHKFPLIVKIRTLDLEIKIFEQTTEIHREYNEISCLNRETGTVTEVRRRKDLSGYYAINFSAKSGQLSSIYGNSDRSTVEDMIALRRGVMDDKREYVEFNNGQQGYEIYWISEKVPSREIKSYKVISTGIGGSKIQIGFENEIIDIVCWPQKDYMVIRHKTHGQDVPCCDLGKPSRDREREGIFVACGKIQPLVYK